MNCGAWIEPSYRGQGILLELINEGCFHAQQIGLNELYASIFIENDHSREAFEKAGFIHVETRPSLYQPDRMIDLLSLAVGPD